MEAILNFLADNYKWFMIGAVVLLVALIGFIVDGKKKKNKNEELPENTATINQVDAVSQSQNVVPTQEVEQSLVFEQPSLNDNDTMSELKESGVEPSLTFENNNVEPQNPTYYGNAEQAVNETISNNNVIGDAITTPDMVYNPVEKPIVVETPVYTAPAEPFVMNEIPATPMVETPVVETPIVEVPVVEMPTMPTPEQAPVVETPVVTVPTVETPVVNINPTNNNTPM